MHATCFKSVSWNRIQFANDPCGSLVVHVHNDMVWSQLYEVRVRNNFYPTWRHSSFCFLFPMWLKLFINCSTFWPWQKYAATVVGTKRMYNQLGKYVLWEMQVRTRTWDGIFAIPKWRKRTNCNSLREKDRKHMYWLTTFFDPKTAMGINYGLKLPGHVFFFWGATPHM